MANFKLDTTTIAATRNFLMGNVSHARYKAGGTWRQAEIAARNILSDNRVSIGFILNKAAVGDDTVTNVEIYGTDGRRWGAQAVNIDMSGVALDIMYRVTFTVKQSA